MFVETVAIAVAELEDEISADVVLAVVIVVAVVAV